MRRILQVSRKGRTRIEKESKYQVWRNMELYIVFGETNKGPPLVRRPLRLGYRCPHRSDEELNPPINPT